MLTGLQLLTLKLLKETTPLVDWFPELELPDISAVSILEQLSGLHRLPPRQSRGFHTRLQMRQSH